MTDDASVPPPPTRWQTTRLVRLGLAAWSIVGLVVVVVIVLVAMAAISEIAVPVLLGALVAVVVKPAADALTRRGLRPTLSAGLVLAVLLVVVGGVIAAVWFGLAEQSEQIAAAIDDALAVASEDLSLDSVAMADTRVAVTELGPFISRGALTNLVSGIGSLIGFISGLLLALIVLYYMVKDGTRLRAGLVRLVGPEHRSELDDFVGDSCRTLRSYAHGRTIMSAIVTLVMGITAALLGLPLLLTIVAITFIGGYIPYIGAFIAGGFTVLVALGDGGVTPALVVLIVSLAANLLLENLVEPKVMGNSLHIHPLVVLIVTALGGLLGGIIGLIIAVPLAVILGSAFSLLRSSGQLERAAARARPAAEKLLGTEPEIPSEPMPPLS